MFRWSLLLFSLALAALSSLTAIKAPDWSPWRLAVLSGEFGYLLAPVPLLIAAVAWLWRGDGSGGAAATVLVCAVAFGLFLKPCVEAAQLGRTLSERMTAAFGHREAPEAAFSFGGFFRSRPAAVSAETRTFSGELALDFFRAPGTDPRGVPCLVVIHGGGWDSGDRTQLATFNHWLVSRGYAVAAVSYRLAPKHIWPAQQEDVRAALAYLKTRAGELGIDPTRLVLLGRSAGGQIAEAAGYAANDPAIRGVVGLYAPSDMNFASVNAHEDDMLKSPTLMRQFLGGPPEAAPAAYDSASALPRVNGRTPPTLLIHGQLDALVWHRHSERLDAKLAEQGVPHVFLSLPWATHAFEYNLNGPGGQLTSYAVEWFLAAVTR